MPYYKNWLIPSVGSPPAGPTYDYYHAAAGRNGGVYDEICEKYDISGNSWSSFTDFPGTGTYARNVTGGALDGNLYIPSYFGGNYYYNHKRWDGSSWSNKSNLGAARITASCGAIDGALYVTCGERLSKYDDTYEYTEDSWTTKTDYPGSASAYGALAGNYDNAIGLVVQGYTGSAVVNEVYTYDPDTWTLKTDYAESTAFAFTLISPPGDDKFYKVGGSPTTVECEVYDLSGDSWTAKADNTYGHYRGPTVGQDGTDFYVHGGQDSSNAFTEENEKYSVSGDSWSDMTATTTARGWGAAGDSSV